MVPLVTQKETWYVFAWWVSFVVGATALDAPVGGQSDPSEPAYRTTGGAATHSPECRCSIRLVVGRLIHPDTALGKLRQGSLAPRDYHALEETVKAATGEYGQNAQPHRCSLSSLGVLQDRRDERSPSAAQLRDSPSFCRCRIVWWSRDRYCTACCFDSGSVRCPRRACGGAGRADGACGQPRAMGRGRGSAGASLSHGCRGVVADGLGADASGRHLRSVPAPDRRGHHCAAATAVVRR